MRPKKDCLIHFLCYNNIAQWGEIFVQKNSEN